MSRTTLLGMVLLAIGSRFATAAHAQIELGADLDLASSYVWRGLTLTNRPVAKPGAYLAIPAGNVSLTVGAAGNIDLGQYDDPTDHIAESGGSSAFNLAEFNPYAEASFPVGRATLTGGVVGYLYPNDEDAPNSLGLFTSDDNTVELYGKVGLDLPLSPELSLYYDVDKVKGAYLEGSLSYSLPVSENVSLELGTVAGFSAGQGDTSDDLGEASRFDDDGLTHLDISAGVPFTAGAVSVTPAVHLLVNVDERTKVTSPAQFDKDFKLWAGVSLGWSSALEEELEETDDAQ